MFQVFRQLEAPNDRGEYLHRLLGAFSHRFVACNPDLAYSPDLVYVLCFSLILLSVDLTSPHVKNKMSKREFIRNTRNAVRREENQNRMNANANGGGDDDIVDSLGGMYDNVFLRGHVSDDGGDGGAALVRQRTRHHQFVPGYLAIFL
jgi:F-box protein 8